MKVALLNSFKELRIYFYGNIRSPVLCRVVEFAVDEIEDLWIIPMTQTDSGTPSHVSTNDTACDLMIDEHAVESLELFPDAVVHDVSCSLE